MNHMNKKKECEELWAKNKYYVLSKSHKVYLEIRKYLKEKEIEFSEFELQRRIDSGDKRAEKMLNKKKFIPVYNYFLQCYLVYLLLLFFLILFQFPYLFFPFARNSLILQ